MGELEKHVGLHDGALISPEPDVLTFSIGLFSASVYLSSRQDGPKRSLVRFIFGKDQTAPNGVEPFCLVFFFCATTADVNMSFSPNCQTVRDCTYV